MIERVHIGRLFEGKRLLKKIQQMMFIIIRNESHNMPSLDKIDKIGYNYRYDIFYSDGYMSYFIYK